jgi:hypothetical protein
MFEDPTRTLLPNTHGEVAVFPSATLQAIWGDPGESLFGVKALPWPSGQAHGQPSPMAITTASSFMG